MKEAILNRIPEDVTHGRGYVYSLQYHIVWCTKYRKQLFVSGLEEEVKGHLKEVAEYLQARIIAMEVMPDHVHLLLDSNRNSGHRMRSKSLRGIRPDGCSWPIPN